MFVRDDVARLRCELWMPFPSPLALGKVVALHDFALIRARMAPAFVVAWLPRAVRCDNDMDTGIPDSLVDDAKIVEQSEPESAQNHARPPLCQGRVGRGMASRVRTAIGRHHRARTL